MTAPALDDDTRAGYLLALGDDALVLAQRLGEWSGRAPVLEEEMALANLALDLLGQARALLTRAGALRGRGEDEDDLALGRDERDFRNVQLVERPNGDFAHTIARQLYFSAYQLPLYRALLGSADPLLAAVAGKAVKEVAYHREHAALWTIRLGDGTEESHRRMRAALDALWPYTGELFQAEPGWAPLVEAGVAVDPTTLRDGWLADLREVLAEARLDPPTGPDRHVFAAGGGRQGVHSEAMGPLLAEMQYLHRSHPGASW